MWFWLSEFSHVVCWNSSLLYGAHCCFHLHTTQVNRPPNSDVIYRRRTEDVTRLYVHGMSDKWVPYLMGMLSWSFRVKLVYQIVSDYLQTLKYCLKVRKPRGNNSVCLSWLLDIYGHIWHSVYKIRFALRMLKLLGVKSEDFRDVEWKYSGTRL